MFGQLKLGRLICCFIIALILTCTTLANDVKIEQLTFCGEASSDKPSSSLVFVSTLDGKISALDAASNGEPKWTLEIGEGPMISSNIHRRELNNNGQWVRLIPSLNGGLYKFDGENIEAIPLNSDNLLQSSFRYTDDLVFSGGKETQSYGVSTSTGKILYECNISGCTNKTDETDRMDEEVLIVQRFQKTVRAIEPRRGHERWNFSVAQHVLSIVPHDDVDCHDNSRLPPVKMDLQFELKVIVPEGRIMATDKHAPDVTLWQHKFNSPIVSIWQVDHSANSESREILKQVDLFSSSQWLWGSESSLSPSIYLGMHDKQLYIQESQSLNKMLETLQESVVQTPKFPWQPYPAISDAVANVKSAKDNQQITELTAESQTTAISVLYGSEYVNGNGFYLYTDADLHAKDSEHCNSSSPQLDESYDEIEEPSLTDYLAEGDDTPVRVIIVSLWYWWKEVVIISITTAIILNFMLTQRLLNATTATREAIAPPLIVERHIETKEDDTRLQGDGTAEFKSRYLTDFEPIDCLGKGGYGVVFEAKNKIDDCNYAIKRIALQNSRDSRERVMREVKALAMLDHHNIVRYFNAWLECPPMGWQEKHDQCWIGKQKFPHSEFSYGLSLATSKPSDSVCIDVPHSNPSSIDSAFEAYKLDDHGDNSDSFIVFERSNSGGFEESENVIDLTNCDTSPESTRSKKDTKVDLTNHTDTTNTDLITGDHVEESSDVNALDKSDKKRLSLSNSGGKSRTSKQKPIKMFLYIQMQLCQRLSLREWLKQEVTPRDTRRILKIFQQIVDAVEYVHLQGLIHRDLKPSNIFFAFDDKIKIGDFGLVTAMTVGCNEVRNAEAVPDINNISSSIHTARVGTHLYMSPEQMSGQVYDYKVDIYSLGIIFYELLVPFSTEMERTIALRDLKKMIFPPDFSKNHSAEYDLLTMMLDEDPKKRPTTLGIKARAPLANLEMVNSLDLDKERWHFDLPHISRHSSVTSSSSGESWENIN